LACWLDILRENRSLRFDMHLPDGFLDMKTTLLSAGAATAGISYALRQTRELGPKRVPMLGLAAAFVFAAQMLNFPVAGGTSGHVIGGVLAAVLLGPAAAVIVMTCVLLVQCLMFADGGLLALGANVFNMGIASTCGGYLVFRGARLLMPHQGSRGIVFAAAFAGWCGTVLGAISCAGQLALSHTVPWRLVFPAMTNVHMIIGLGEGLATGLIVAAVVRARPELVFDDAAETPSGRRSLLGYAGLIAIGLAIFVAPFASPWPDGLERVAEQLGFHDRAQAAVVQSGFADYQIPWIGSPTLATAIAGLLGTATAFVAAWVLARVLVPALGAARKDAGN
jgi:cobalt/nickel transport system permease protein